MSIRSEQGEPSASRRSSSEYPESLDSPFSQEDAQELAAFLTTPPVLGERWCESMSPPPTLPPEVLGRPLASLPESKRDLIGLVIWPHQLDWPLAHLIENQKPYTQHLNAGIEAAAADLRVGQFPTLLDLWKRARHIRYQAPTEVNRKFLSSRHPSEAGWLANPAFTPLLARYTYLFDRVRALSDYRPTDDSLPPRKGWLVDNRGQAKEVGLTAFHLRPFIECPILQRRNVPGTLPQISHTPTEALDAVLNHAEALYRQALTTPNDAQFEEDAARLYWWLAQAMPDERGSAAKTEICFRTLYAARGLYCPIWKAGVSADIEAMLRHEEEWMAEYRALQRN
jgi:avirulence protein